VFDVVFVENMTFHFGDFNLDMSRIKVRGVLDGNVCATALSHAGAYGEAGRLDSGSRVNVVSNGSRQRTEQRNWW
jgi:hypothetical protein